MLKVMITGGKGMLGRSLIKEFQDFHITVTGKDNCDITDYTIVDNFIQSHSPQVIIHCAAMTEVDICEKEVDLAYKINAIGSQNIAIASNKYNVRLISISTDYVFDGNKIQAYNEYDFPNPKNIYGKSKLAGEEAIKLFCKNYIIARVSWLYGSGGPSFLHNIIKLADGSKDILKIVSDQIGNPTSTTSVARSLKYIINNTDLKGIFHLTCEGEASWYDFAKEIFKLKNIKQNITPCTTQEFLRPASRPANSRLDKMNLRLYNLPKMPYWKDALKEFLQEEVF